MAEGKRKYGRPHRRVRARYARDVAAGRAFCARCHKPISPFEAWDLDHDDSDPTGRRYLGPSHRRCNRATITHLKEAGGGWSPGDRFGRWPDPTPGNTVDRWSRHWSGPFNPRCPVCRRTGEPCELANRFAAEEAA